MFDCLVKARRSNTYRVLTKRKNVLREKNVAEHEFSCTAGQTCQSLWKASSEAACHGEGAGPSASIWGLFQEDFAHPCQSRAGLREAQGKGGGAASNHWHYDYSACLSHNQKILPQHIALLRTKVLFLPQQCCLSASCLFILFPWVFLSVTFFFPS